MNDYQERHLIELSIRPEVWEAFSKLNKVTMQNDLGPRLTLEIFTVASLGAGCRHCQSHGAFGLSGIGVAGWLNRWNDTLATVTDQESVDWAESNLADVGWSIGKHTGDSSEQRRAHPATMWRQGKDPLQRD